MLEFGLRASTLEGFRASRLEGLGLRSVKGKDPGLIGAWGAPLTQRPVTPQTLNPKP